MLSWQMKANKPIPITVNFSATIIGDTLNGSARLGIFGKSILKGERLQAGTPRPAPSTNDDDAPAIVTADSHDPRYAPPYVDITELRREPVPHRYVNRSDERRVGKEGVSKCRSRGWAYNK